MKVAFSTQIALGLQSTVFNHFGSASFFIIVETDDDSHIVVVNKDKDHQHGQCQPLNALDGEKTDAVVVGGIGGGALRKLNDAGVKVFKGIEGSVKENLEMIKENKLIVYTSDMTCGGHGPDGVCIH